MKTYESERKKLYEWNLKVTKEYFEEEKREMDKNGITRDSEANEKYLKHHRDYIQKQKALREKYGIK